jgi:hypothetical protein
MAGMEAFGREWNVCAVASGVGINIRDASSIAYILTGDGSDVFHATLSICATLAGSYVNSSISWNPVTHYYTNSDNGAGTGTWTKVANNSTPSFFVGGSYLVPYTGNFTDSEAVVIEVLASQVPAGYNYIKCSVSAGTGLCVAVTDLDVQRAPANLPAMSL